jgi:hypothetical protein
MKRILFRARFDVALGTSGFFLNLDRFARAYMLKLKHGSTQQAVVVGLNKIALILFWGIFEKMNLAEFHGADLSEFVLRDQDANSLLA